MSEGRESMTADDFQPRVYLLYHPCDQEVARQLGTVLREEYGIDVWLDVWEIGPGDTVTHKIEDAIESSEGGLILLSEHGLAGELDRGIYAALIRRMLDAGKYVIPLRHGAVPKVPVLLEDLRAVGSRDHQAIHRAILRRHGRISVDDGRPKLKKPQVERPADRRPPTDLERLRSCNTPLLLYVGPELSTAAQLPSRRELAQMMFAEVPDHVPATRRAALRELCEIGDLADAFTELQRDLGEQRFGRIVEYALDDSRSQSLPELAWAIARLGRRLQGVITPNLDNLLERAFKGNLITHHTLSPGLAHDHGWLLKIHGTRTIWDSWVFTRAQRDRALYRDPALAEVFRSLLIGNSVLFIGAPVDDPISSAVIDRIRALASGGKAPRHWALLPEAEASPITRIKLEEAGISAITFKDEAERLDILDSLAYGAP